MSLDEGVGHEEWGICSKHLHLLFLFVNDSRSTEEMVHFYKPKMFTFPQNWLDFLYLLLNVDYGVQ